MLFAAGLALERDPLSWADMPVALKGWLQTAGGIAAFALAVWALAYFVQRLNARAADRPKISGEGKVVFGAGALAAVLYLLAGAWFLLELVGAVDAPPALQPDERAPLLAGVLDGLLTLAGAAALAAVLWPILRAVATRLSWRRIWAMARLARKEAVRSRVVLVFGVMAMIFLFADWFLPLKKPEDQLANYVRVIYWSMTPLFLVTASLLGSFSIPTDLKNQSMHTIVTKPVERFEIVLGRFLGYGVVLTLGLMALTGVSLLYVARGVGPAAAKESFTARMPIFGQLRFWGTKDRRGEEREGTSVGRESTRRGYISGSPQPGMPRQYAWWNFADLPSGYADDANVRFQFTFDIFRLTKGVENKGVPCTFAFVDGRLSIPEIERKFDEYRRDEDRLFARTKDQREIHAQLIAAHRMFVHGGEEVADYHTQQLEVPAKLFHVLRQAVEEEGSSGAPAFKVVVRVDPDRLGQTQMLGVARHDLYLLSAEGPFWLNFIKGIVGLWLLTLAVLGIAVACSTYLSGIITWIVTITLLMGGLAEEYIQQIAENREPGGGPVESAIRLAQKSPQIVPLEESPTTTVVQGIDEGFRWLLRRILNILPDTDRYDLHMYVANGFDISWVQVLFLDNFLVLLGYLLPWAVLAYYLMRFREVANPG